MPAFSDRSKERMETVHPCLRLLFQAVVRQRDCTVLCGVRSKPEQDRLYNLGHSRVMWPNSKHNVQDPDGLALAIDVAPWFPTVEGGIIWPDPAAPNGAYPKQVGIYYNFAGYVQSVADRQGIRVRWGGDWDGDGDYRDQTFDDLVHWELIDV